MDAARIELLIESINRELPFSPPFQYKKFTDEPYPLTFTENVTYLGDWTAQCLHPYSKIEWFCVRPQYLKNIGRLVSPKVISCEPEFLQLLQKLDIPFSVQDDSMLIYCNKTTNKHIKADSQ